MEDWCRFFLATVVVDSMRSCWEPAPKELEENPKLTFFVTAMFTDGLAELATVHLCRENWEAT
jgi:hypothetical protein